jgi:hypothetical protein
MVVGSTKGGLMTSRSRFFKQEVRKQSEHQKHQSVVISRELVDPIGPQKTKSQLQAKSKADSKDDGHLQSISEFNMENPEEQNDDVSTGSEEMGKQTV